MAIPAPQAQRRGEPRRLRAPARARGRCCAASRAATRCASSRWGCRPISRSRSKKAPPACASAPRSSARDPAEEEHLHDARGSADRLHRRRRDGGGARRRTDRGRHRARSDSRERRRGRPARAAGVGARHRDHRRQRQGRARERRGGDRGQAGAGRGRARRVCGRAPPGTARSGSRSQPAFRSRGSRARCPPQARIVRAMPNTPALVRAGATGLCGNAAVGAGRSRAGARALRGGRHGLARARARSSSTR